MDKHILTTEEMINELKNKNIKFEKIKESKAKEYLELNCSYYNLLSYTNDFQVYYENKKPTNRFIDLDFAYLKDLSIIDQKLRNLLYDMLMEIEYYLKVSIYKMERDLGNNGYDIVNKYLESDYDGEQHLHTNILNKVGKNEYKEIITKYDIDKDKKLENIPLWEFMSLITFGELIDFYDYFSLENNLKKEHKLVYLLRDTLRLRNAICHNNSLLNNLNEKDKLYNPNYIINKYLSEIGIGKDLKENKLSNSRIRQITSLLYLFNIVIPSKKVKAKVNNKIETLILRIKNHEEYYNNNELLKSTYYFFKIIVEKEYKN